MRLFQRSVISCVQVTLQIVNKLSCYCLFIPIQRTLSPLAQCFPMNGNELPFVPLEFRKGDASRW